MSKPSRPRVLVVEDVASIAAVYQTQLERAGYSVLISSTFREAIKAVEDEQFATIILDLNLPDNSGLVTLREISSHAGLTSIIVATSEGSIKTAVEAMQIGAYDFVVKPINPERLLTTVQNATERSSLKKNLALMKENFSRGAFQKFIGQSFQMQAVYRAIEAVAKSDAPVFLTGESGTGKELAAEAVHNLSSRSGKPFVALNCGSIPRDLVTSELFGHLKGSFTGAISDRPGAVKQAEGGTLFLDEICEMQIDLQPELLRFLQTGTFRPVGAVRTEKIDVRIVCATNRDPLKEVAAGRFREDLFYRLHVVPISLPALRERDEDVLEIAQAFLATYSQHEKKSKRSLSKSAIEKLLAYNWPGNVRQLQNVIRNTIVMHEEEIIEATMLPIPDLSENLGKERIVTDAPEKFVQSPTERPVQVSHFDPESWNTPADIVFLDGIERVAIERAIKICEGNVLRAATFLGLSPSTVYRKRASWGS